jgi:SAM-dependent methyltransferase
MYEVVTGCRACGAQALLEVLPFGDMPLSDGLRDAGQLDAAEPRYPLTVVFCPACSLLQILETVEPTVLYGSDYPYYSSFSDDWLKHCRANALELIERRALGPSSLVVELAANDGYMLRNFVARGVPVLGIDPAPGPVAAARAAGIPMRQTFFTRTLADQLRQEGLEADLILGNNVLAHVADLGGFVEGLRALLKPQGMVVMEVPYVRDMIDHCEFDTVYHEHHCYFSGTALDRLFARHRLTLADVRRIPTHGGSLRLFVAREGAPPSEAVRQLLRDEHELGVDSAGYYRDFAMRARAIQRSLRDLLASLKAQGKRIAGYGASAKGAILVNSSGIGPDLVDYVVDRNVHKQGRYLPGVDIRIEAPSRLTTDPPDYLLLLVWNIKDEILGQQAEFRNLGGRMIVPIPSPQVV